MWAKTDKNTYTHIPSGALLRADLEGDESSVELLNGRIITLASDLTEVGALSVIERLVDESGEEVIRWLDVTKT